MSHFKFVPESLDDAKKYLASKGALSQVLEIQLPANLEWIAIIETANKLKIQEEGSDNIIQKENDTNASIPETT